MTNVTIHADAFRAMAIDAPSHRLIYLATHAMHLSNLAVTRRAFETRANVRLMRVEHIRLRFVPVHASPRRLLLALGERGELLHLRALGHDRLVTAHAGRDVWNGSV